MTTRLAWHMLAAMPAALMAQPALAQPPCQPRQAARPLLRIIEADNAADLRQVMQHYSADPIWISPTAPPLRGTEAVRRSYVSMYREFAPHLTVTPTRIRSGEHVALIAGRTGGRLVRRVGGPGRIVNDEFEAVVICEGGVWRVATLRWWPRQRR